MKQNKICQSCGMPLKKDPKKGGTNADGYISEEYCSYCYENGEFINPCDSVEVFQEYCRQMMIKGGHSRITAWLFSRGIKRLKRWK